MFPGLSRFNQGRKFKERRASFRGREDQEAVLVVPGEPLTLSCRVANISAGGASILCDPVVESGTKIRLVLKDGRVFEGVTVWFDEGQLGLRFVSRR